MNKKILSRLIFGAALLLLAACSQDEATDPNALPEGQYPLQIASVTMDVTHSEQPWGVNAPQTRVSENTDGNSSAWEIGDIISVKPNGAPAAGTFRVTTINGTVEMATPTYWTKTTENVTAWFPAEETVSFADQSTKLAYVLQATATNAAYSDPVSLNFTHQLAKVRVVLNGDQASQVRQLAVYGYTACTNNQGTVGVGNMSQGWINMKQTTYGDNSKCWEANVVPGFEINKVQVNSIEVGLTTAVTPQAAKVHKITITVGTVDLTELEDLIYTVEENRSVIIDGKNTPLDRRIIIEDGATVTLKDVVLNPTTIVEGHEDFCGIDVQGNAKIILKGTNSISNPDEHYTIAAIQISAEKTLTIEGDGRLDLTVAEADNNYPIWLRRNANLIINSGTIVADATRGNGGSRAVGIGSCTNNEPFGSITISGGTVTAKGSENNPGIGGCCYGGICGEIRITGGTVTATGGSKATYDIGPGLESSCSGKITIGGGATVKNEQGGSCRIYGQE